MTTQAQLQLLFPLPGDWTQYTLTAIHEDADGYTSSDTYTQDAIPADQLPALSAVVAALVGLAAPWQASQVRARLDQLTSFTPAAADGDAPPTVVVTAAVELAVEAINDQGGRRTFTSCDYPDFVITDSAAVAFFRHFTAM